MYVCTTGGSGRRQMGGAERILVDLIPAIAQRGVDVLACTTDDDVAASLRESGIEWVGMGARRRIDLRYAHEIGAVVDSFAPDIVCSHLLSAAMHARAALGVTRRRTRLVVTLHNSLWQYRDAAASFARKAQIQSNIALDLLLRRLRPHASVAVSRFEADELIRRGRSRNVHIIPNPLPATWPAGDPGSSQLSVVHNGQPRSSGVARVGFLGRHEVEKGIDLLPGIAQRLPDVHFVVAGTGSRTPAPTANLELVGRVDAAEFLRRLDALIVPSRVESFGLSALEAMSMGVPVVHSGAGGLREITGHASGVLAHQAALDAPSMAAAVKAALAPVPAPRRLAVAGHYVNEYAFSKFVDRWHGLYRMLTDAVR
jgi:glycosyltransferase involved in cell wall biosynthesis